MSSNTKTKSTATAQFFNGINFIINFNHDIDRYSNFTFHRFKKPKKNQKKKPINHFITGVGKIRTVPMTKMKAKSAPSTTTTINCTNRY